MFSHGGQELPDSMDVIISVGFLRGIIMQEQAKRGKDWNSKADFDTVKIVISAIVPSTGFQAETFLSSGALESPKKVDENFRYNAVFPLKSRHSNGAPTRIVLPGLIQKDKTAGQDEFQNQYKRQTVELLITLVFGNEAFTLGKTTLMVTGEEVKTKQTDLPIDTTKKPVLQLQKKSTFPMKRQNSISSNKKGQIAPQSFKYDRRRRKYQIESDAVLRTYMKCVPSDPYKDQKKNEKALPQAHPVGYNDIYSSPSSRNNGIPRVINPNGQDSISYNPSNLDYSARGNLQQRGSIMDRRDPYSSISYTRDRSLSAPRTGLPHTGSVNAMQNMDSPPGQIIMTHQRSSSSPRQRMGSFSGQGSAYGGSSYGAGGSRVDYTLNNAVNRGRSMSRGGGGSSHYSSPSRKAYMNQGSQYGMGQYPSTGSRHNIRSQSPHIYQRQY